MFPDCKVIDEYDWSGVHGVKKEDGLDASTMNVKFGGAVNIKHDTTIIDGCLGPHPATITMPDGTEHDRKLQLHQTQSMVFLETDPPPFYDLTCPKLDTGTGEMRKKKKKRRQVKQTTVQSQMAPRCHGEGQGQEQEEEEEQEEVIRHGYVGKPKGLADIAFERGFLDPLRLVMNDGKMKIGYQKDAKVIDGIPDESYSLVSIVGRCQDFLNEPTAMAELGVLLGH